MVFSEIPSSEAMVLYAAPLRRRTATRSFSGLVIGDTSYVTPEKMRKSNPQKQKIPQGKNKFSPAGFY